MICLTVEVTTCVRCGLGDLAGRDFHLGQNDGRGRPNRVAPEIIREPCRWVGTDIRDEVFQLMPI